MDADQHGRAAKHVGEPPKISMFEGEDQQGYPFIGMSNGHYHDFKWKADFAWCLNVHIGYTANDNGFPLIADENTQIQELQQSFFDFLAARLTVLDVLHVSGNGCREIIWYVAKPADAERAIEEFLANGKPRWTVQHAISQDSKWQKAERYLGQQRRQFHFEVFSPLVSMFAPKNKAMNSATARVFELVGPVTVDEADRAVLRAMSESGSDMRRPTQINWSLYFSSRTDLVHAQSDVRSIGYNAEVLLPMSDYAKPAGPVQYCLLVTLNDTPAIETIATIRVFLSGIAKRYGGEVDGWEAAAQRRLVRWA